MTKGVCVLIAALVAVSCLAAFSTAQSCECPDGNPSFMDAVSETDAEANGYIVRVRVRANVKDNDERSTWVAKVKRVYRQPECDPMLEANQKILVTAPKDDCFYEDFGEKTAAYLIFPERTTDDDDDRETFRISTCYPNNRWDDLKATDDKVSLKKTYPLDEGTFLGTACSEGPVDPEPSGQLEDVIDALVDSGVTDRGVLETVESAPRLAAEWILDDGVPTDDDLFVQRFALATFYYSTDGDNWFFSSNFLSEDPECSWFGVTCNDDGEVIGLSIVANNLVGVLPQEVGSGLPKLEKIQLSSNKIAGTVPESIGALTYLTSLILSRNSLEGEPLPGFGGNANLTEVFLSENMFSGPIPAVLGTVPSLETIQLDGNQLTGNIPIEVGQLPFLKVFDVSSNAITGTLSPGLFAAWGFMTKFIVSDNQLTGTIPAEASSIGSMNFFESKELDFSFNLFTGTIPAEFARVPLIEKLLLEGNDLTGSVSPGICVLVGTGFFGPALTDLTVDCDEVECDCCTNCE